MNLLLLLACVRGGEDSEVPITGFQLDYRADPEPPVAGAPATLTFSILDQAGRPVEDLQQNHQRMVHVLLISADLESFEHKHHEDYAPITAEDLRTATFTIPETFPKSGPYLLAFDFAYANAYWQLTTDEVVGGDLPQLDAPVVDLATEVAAGDLRVSFTWEVEPQADFEAILWAHLTDSSGAPITDLTQWLGADAHLVIVRSDLSSIGHTHAYVEGMEDVPPDHDMPHEYSGPDLPFHFMVDEPGVYKAWLQFARATAPDAPLTVPFMFEVAL